MAVHDQPHLSEPRIPRWRRFAGLFDQAWQRERKRRHRLLVTLLLLIAAGLTAATVLVHSGASHPVGGRVVAAKITADPLSDGHLSVTFCRQAFGIGSYWAGQDHGGTKTPFVSAPVQKVIGKWNCGIGAYPILSPLIAGAESFNDAIRTDVSAIESAQIRWMRQDDPNLHVTDGRLNAPGPGLFLLGPSRANTYATVHETLLPNLVSVLIPTEQFVPGGTGNDQGWLSVNFNRTTGKMLKLSSFITPMGIAALPSKILAAIRREARSSREARCTLHGAGTGTRLWAAQRRYLASRHAISKNFAWTPSGLVIGYAAGQLTNAICNSLAVTIPSNQTGPLTTLGKTTVRQLRFS